MSKAKNKPKATKTTKPTDISLISGKRSRRNHPKEEASFFMMRGYQLMLVLFMIALFLLAMVYQTLFGRIEQDKQMVTIEQGQTYYGLLPEWQSQVPLFSSSIAKLYIRATMPDPLHAGTYALPANPTLPQVLDILGQGAKSAMVKVQIIEGKTANDLYQSLRATPGVKLEVLSDQHMHTTATNTETDGDPKTHATAHDPNSGMVVYPHIKQQLGLDIPTGDEQLPEHLSDTLSGNLEGWFAPDTYYFAEGSSDTKILTDLYARQQKLLDDAWATRATDLPYRSPYEALIMASIIEKETGVADERQLVAAVFVNRLRKGMRLQTDPTIIYGLGQRYDGNIRRRDIDEKTLYNTYQINGLPPTPIALPSKASIEAAMHPADSDMLYFVATGTGGHTFSRTLAEHNQAVQAYRQVMREQQATSTDSNASQPNTP